MKSESIVNKQAQTEQIRWIFEKSNVDVFIQNIDIGGGCTDSWDGTIGCFDASVGGVNATLCETRLAEMSASTWIDKPIMYPLSQFGT